MIFSKQCSLCMKRVVDLHSERIGSGKFKVNGNVCNSCLVEILKHHLYGGTGIFLESDDPKTYRYIPFGEQEINGVSSFLFEKIMDELGGDCFHCDNEATCLWIPRGSASILYDRSMDKEEWAAAMKSVRGYCMSHMPVFFKEYLLQKRVTLKKFRLPASKVCCVFC